MSPGRIPATGLITGIGRLVTFAGGAGPLPGLVEDGGVLRDAAIAWHGDTIAWVGAASEAAKAVELAPGTAPVDAGGRAVIPGLIDPHTHLVFAGSREDEWEERLRGVSYAEIAARGGGILSTVRATRAADSGELERL